MASASARIRTQTAVAREAAEQAAEVAASKAAKAAKPAHSASSSRAKPAPHSTFDRSSSSSPVAGSIGMATRDGTTVHSTEFRIV